MNRATYIRKRLLMMLFVIFGVTVIIFSMVRFLPGDPAFLMLGERATDQTAAANLLDTAEFQPPTEPAAPVG